jgi:hypothetical protein
MADITDDNQDELETPEGEGAEIEAPEGAEEQPEAEEYSIEIDGEESDDDILSEAPDDTPLQKKLRAKLKDAIRDKADATRERDELRRSIVASQPKIEVGDKPTLESCDYDEERFETQLDDWKERKRAFENQEEEAGKQAQVRNQEFQRRATTYRAKLEALPLPAEQKQAAEKTVIDALPELLQSAIVSYADDPAKVVIALAKHPQKLQQLAQEQDPILFIKGIWNLERNLKVVTKKKPPAADAENIVRGSAPLSHTADKELDRLEKEAERTKDRSKVQQYLREKRKKAA